MGIKVRIWWDSLTSSYLMKCQWSKQTQSYITAVKAAVPSGDRDYNPDTKTWYMKEQYGEAIRGFAQAVFGISSVSFVSRSATEASERNRPIQPSMFGDIQQALNEFFGLVGSTAGIKATYEEAKKAYRQTAARLHPDKGGDPAQMSRLNELWTRIEKEYYKK